LRITSKKNTFSEVVEKLESHIEAKSFYRQLLVLTVMLIKKDMQKKFTSDVLLSKIISDGSLEDVKKIISEILDSEKKPEDIPDRKLN
jgi:predicted CopG family antitoxin